MQFRVIAPLAAFAASVSAIPTGSDSPPAPSQGKIDKWMHNADANGCKVLGTFFFLFLNSITNSNNFWSIDCAVALGVAPATCSLVFLQFGMGMCFCSPSRVPYNLLVILPTRPALGYRLPCCCSRFPSHYCRWLLVLSGL